MKHGNGDLIGRRLWLRHALLCAALLVLCCASGYRFITLSDLDFKKCWLSKPGNGVAVWAVKQPLYESGNKSCHQASIQHNIGVFVVKIENSGEIPLRIDSTHVAVLDGSGNPAPVIKNAETAAKLLSRGRAMKDDFASNPLEGSVLEHGKSHSAFICVATQGDPYFATYYLRFYGDDGKVITDARF